VKHAIEGMSDALHQDVVMLGIDVTIIGPGPIAAMDSESTSRAFPALKQAADRGIDPIRACHDSKPEARKGHVAERLDVSCG
jgi:NAD(P)-dependent dehydrogenase (short-subunit alcohol dehydrogenase family)